VPSCTWPGEVRAPSRHCCRRGVKASPERRGSFKRADSCPSSSRSDMDSSVAEGSASSTRASAARPWGPREPGVGGSGGPRGLGKIRRLFPRPVPVKIKAAGDAAVGQDEPNLDSPARSSGRASDGGGGGGRGRQQGWTPGSRSRSRGAAFSSRSERVVPEKAGESGRQ
jgi:hypothetical protein